MINSVVLAVVESAKERLWSFLHHDSEQGWKNVFFFFFPVLFYSIEDISMTLFTHSTDAISLCSHYILSNLHTVFYSRYYYLDTVCVPVCVRYYENLSALFMSRPFLTPLFAGSAVLFCCSAAGGMRLLLSFSLLPPPRLLLLSPHSLSLQLSLSLSSCVSGPRPCFIDTQGEKKRGTCALPPLMPTLVLKYPHK